MCFWHGHCIWIHEESGLQFRGMTFLVSGPTSPCKKSRLVWYNEAAPFLSALGKSDQLPFDFGNALIIHQLLQFASFKHFHHDVAATNKFAFDVKLRNGGPI